MTQPAPLTDHELFRRMRAGHAAALDELFRRHYADLCRIALRFVNHEAAAEDIVQELFVSLWEKRDGEAATPEAVGPYLRRAARNRSLNWLRDRKRVPVDDGEVPLTIATPARADDDLQQDELRHRIHAAIDRLPERSRLVFVMSKLEEMSHKEIAAALEISPKTVENQMTRAYRLLRQYLSVLVALAAVLTTSS